MCKSVIWPFDDMQLCFACNLNSEVSQLMHPQCDAWRLTDVPLVLHLIVGSWSSLVYAARVALGALVPDSHSHDPLVLHLVLWFMIVTRMCRSCYTWCSGSWSSLVWAVRVTLGALVPDRHSHQPLHCRILQYRCTLMLLSVNVAPWNVQCPCVRWCDAGYFHWQDQCIFDGFLPCWLSGVVVAGLIKCSQFLLVIISAVIIINKNIFTFLLIILIKIK